MSNFINVLGKSIFFLILQLPVFPFQAKSEPGFPKHADHWSLGGYALPEVINNAVQPFLSAETACWLFRLGC